MGRISNISKASRRRNDFLNWYRFKVGGMPITTASLYRIGQKMEEYCEENK